ncbi:GumC family protein [Epilithonimonas lactis]|uniref:non-specific protein-tyrosine kinase n=1 Tax=Epilithonimonas lactis TaxID=421072 RepID=A0A085BL93_9FLAO|nr:polysaccharide biosynthesis tyrosine autokinase [Epilithonimonas lactis]KFC23238.1 hypothetical protein IO89_01200 [Epilithonimonas lactis]SEQ06411.1 capsular exopolysaccharide family [Epilithonimonas lactis]
MELLDSTPLKSGKKINIKKELNRYLKNWYWILLSMLVFYTAAKVYLRYTTPQYLSKTTIQFPETKGKGSAALSDLQTLGVGVHGNEELQSEATAILSKPILARVVDSLNLNVSFYALGKIKELEMYPQAPYSGKVLEFKDKKFVSATYIITPANGNAFTLSEGPLLAGKSQFQFGEVIELPFGTVVLSRKTGIDTSPVKVVFRSTSSWVSTLESWVNVSLPENKGLLMDITIKGAIPEKSENILNEITKQYNIEGVQDRNQEAQNTQDFINRRLDIITQDLSGIEGEKESFKKQNKITDLEAQANMALANSNENTKQILQYATKLDMVNSIFNSSSTEKLLPSNIGLSTVTEEYISKYNDLLLTRNKTLKQATQLNPSVIQMNKDISELRGLIRQNLQESKYTLQDQIAQINGQLNADRSKINNYPTQEKVFRSIERQQNLKEQLYLYLLQKREENAITLAVDAPKAKILNPAYTLGIVEPNQKQMITGALALGFLLPVLWLFGKYTLDTKVHTKEEIQSRIPNAAVIAEIPVKNGEETLIETSDFSVFAESFRILTSNLKFIIKPKQEVRKGNVILITSSIKGEGKTTIAMNTALTLAGASKVLIIGADIRNPQLHRFVKGQKPGLTDYLISNDHSPEKFIIPSGLHHNLDVLFSGAIAPNPNDLLDMPKFDAMIQQLKNQYQYIILDSAPVMLVSDTLHLMGSADVILYIVKSDYTENDMLDFAEEFQRTHDAKNMSFILNNVQPQNTRYGNKYGYGYYSYNEKKKGIKKMFDGKA